MADTELGDVLEETEYLEKPQNDDYHYDAVQDALDLSLHWDIAVDQPQQQADDSKCDDDSDKRHFVFSNHFSNRSTRWTSGGPMNFALFPWLTWQLHLHKKQECSSAEEWPALRLVPA
jgi:hypothetical protein